MFSFYRFLSSVCHRNGLHPIRGAHCAIRKELRYCHQLWYIVWQKPVFDFHNRNARGKSPAKQKTKKENKYDKQKIKHLMRFNWFSRASRCALAFHCHFARMAIGDDGNAQQWGDTPWSHRWGRCFKSVYLVHFFCIVANPYRKRQTVRINRHQFTALCDRFNGPVQCKVKVSNVMKRTRIIFISTSAAIRA